MKDGQQCLVCRYFKNVSNDDTAETVQAGLCTRYPPQWVPIISPVEDAKWGDNYAFPEMFESQWCGEWRAIN